jgi:hypothetical protein
MMMLPYRESKRIPNNISNGKMGNPIMGKITYAAIKPIGWVGPF